MIPTLVRLQHLLQHPLKRLPRPPLPSPTKVPLSLRPHKRRPTSVPVHAYPLVPRCVDAEEQVEEDSKVCSVEESCFGEGEMDLAMAIVVLGTWVARCYGCGEEREESEIDR